jgi:large subunit ribosomal protein L24
MTKIENKPSKKLRRGDKVIAISGNNRGQTGTVLKKEGDKVVVQGLNIRKKHVKRSQANPSGGVIELEKPIHISNLKLCTADDKPVKVKVRSNKDGERQLVYNESGEEKVFRTIKKS